MTCHAIEDHEGNVVGVICAPTGTARRRILACPTCGRRRRFVVYSFEWYGPSAYCLGCGDSWHDGYRAPRPFARGWRPKAIADAKRKWASIGTAA